MSQPNNAGQENNNAGSETGSETELNEAGVKALKAEREARKAAETRFKELETKFKTLEDSKLTDAQKLTNKLADLESKLTESENSRKKAHAESSLLTELTNSGAKSPSFLAKALIGEYDHEANNAKELVASLKQSEPTLFGAAVAGSADGNRNGVTAPRRDSGLRAALGAK